MKFLIWFIAAYLIGNLSPATLLARARGLDIKKEGSGNAGTTNVLRVLGAKAAVITLLIDIGKGFLAAFVAVQFLPLWQAGFCGLAAFLGHVFPVLLKFKGGKGVATSFGVILALAPKTALLLLAVVVVIVALTRFVSLGSVTAAVCYVVFCLLWHRELLASGLLMAIILIVKHRANIGRLLAGKESKIHFSRHGSSGSQPDKASDKTGGSNA